MSFVPCILQKDEPARVSILLYEIWRDCKTESHGTPLHHFFCPSNQGTTSPYKASFKHTHTAQWNVIITHCIVVTNRHTHQVPWSTCQVKHSQEQTVNTRLESKSHGISIWHKGSQVNTKILHHTQTKALTILWYPARDPASFPLTAQNYSSPLLASQHYTRALSSSLSLSFSPRATAYVSLSANTPPCQTVYHNLSRLSVILSMPVGTFTTPRGLSRSPTAISKTGATLIESFSLSDFTRSWVS